MLKEPESSLHLNNSLNSLDSTVHLQNKLQVLDFPHYKMPIIRSQNANKMPVKMYEMHYSSFVFVTYQAHPSFFGFNQLLSLITTDSY